jgi:hypothetical protein
MKDNIMAQDLTNAAQQLSRIDAIDHVNRYVHSERQAITKMQTAISTGDTTMVNALTVHAQKHGWNIGVTLIDAAAKADKGFNAIAEDHAAAVITIRNELVQGNVTTQGSAAHFDAISIKSDWAGQIETIVSRGKAVVAYADKALETAISNLTAQSGGAQDQLLTEMRITRAWDRVRREFEAQGGGLDAPAILRTKLTATTDPYEIAAIITEGPSYLTTNGIKDAAEYINTLLTATIPAIAEAAQAASEAHKFETVLNYDAGILRKMTANTGNAYFVGLKANGYVMLTSVNYTTGQ